MVGLLFRSSLRYFRNHPAQLVLSILGIVLGVALVTAVLITNASSTRAFEQSVSTLTGPVTHRITGGTRGIPEAVFSEFMRSHNLPAAPVISGYLQINGSLYTVQGRDLIAELDVGGSHLRLPVSTGGIESAGSALFISDYTQRRVQFSLVDTITADLNGRTVPIRIAGTFDADNPVASDGILLGDIGYVQKLFDRQGFIDSINLSLTNEHAALLAQTLPPNLQLNPASRQLDTMNQMTRGFQINLTAMSLLALLIGAFLIHNSMTFSVLQRRTVFAIQRLLGTTSRQLYWLIGVEIFCISMIGSLIGIAVGYALAHYLIQLTTRTINDLYFVLHVQQLWFSPWQFLLLLFLGVGTSVLAAMVSAAEAAGVSPLQAVNRSRVESRALQWIPVIAIAGLLMAATGIALALIPSRSLVLGFAAMMLFIIGYGLVLPWAVYHFTHKLHQLIGGTHPILSMIVGSTHQNISRTGLSMAALTIALSATLGVDMMIGSFRYSVSTWLSTTLQSDIYISMPDSGASGVGTGFRGDVVDRLKSLDSVESLSTARAARIDSTGGKIQLLALQPHSQSSAGYQILDGDAAQAWKQFTEQGALLVSEPLANRLSLERGSTLALFTDNAGFVEFPIAGVYRDYGSSHGRLTLIRDTYLEFWDDTGISSVGINLKPDRSPPALLDTLRQWSAEEQQQWLISPNQEIRDQSLEVFDRTFQVTSVLRLLTVGVAFIGVFSALLALQLEKAREVAVLRAIGFTPLQSAVTMLGQTLLMGLLAGLLALPLGWIMSEILIHVINLRSFGWSMESRLPPGVIIETLYLALLSALLAGIYPMWCLSRRTITEQLRDE
ncbi:MAG: FtsX-like permease family protein [Gammaproteobacteria bacterium]|nr:FtsX-like permease family protein [Gammaproteobacteria bacterium]